MSSDRESSLSGYGSSSIPPPPGTTPPTSSFSMGGSGLGMGAYKKAMGGMGISQNGSGQRPSRPMMGDMFGM